MKFGLWVEPEMISPDSDLFREHPEYVLRNPRREPVLRRNQLVLDLTYPAVEEFILQTLDRIIGIYGADYIKWDYNRFITDAYHAPSSAGEEFSLRYIKALYALLGRIREEYPALLIESCAAGGGRYDLGMLCFTPQIWTSDMTDPVERIRIQEGTLAGYPQSTLSAHIASEVCRKTGRRTRLRDRFALALEGVFGIEYDLTQCSREELLELKQAVAFYKEHRDLLLYGDMFFAERAEDGEDAVHVIVSRDKTCAVALVFRLRQVFNCEQNKYRLCGLKEDAVYRVGIYGSDRTWDVQGKLLDSYGLDLGAYFLKDRNGVFSNEINSLVLFMRQV